MKVPFLDPHITPRDIRELVASIKSGWLIHGPYTAQFERKLAAYLHVPYAVMTGSATAALHMSLIIAGVKKGDEVITTPLSWVATSNVILYQGAKVVFADVDHETGILDPKEVEKKITKKTKAILLVHLYGQMADMRRFRAIAKKHRVVLIEDTAHALEAKRDGLRPGQSGLGALSFHVAKNITAGQGGAIVVRTAKEARLAKLLRRDGVYNTPQGHRRMVMLGYKYDATDFQAALLLHQLERVHKQHAARVGVFKRYRQKLSGIPGIRFPSLVPRVVHAGHMFVVWVDPKRRDKIREVLNKKGIQTSIHYDPIHLEPYYRKTFKFKKGDFPVAERLGASTITLPTYSKLSTAKQDYVIRELISAVRQTH
jgi:dTDP-4-amino-4,6-dideoxygalactose transaminase